MKKIIFYLLIMFPFSGLFNITRAQQEQSDATNPLNLPLKLRQSYLEKGNLIQNPSFEKAAIFKNDSLIYNFTLEHWHVIGKDVQLTDITNKEYKRDEAFKGIHAIKIVRTGKDVKEINNESSGVLSDFIKVIPGNYNFYFDIRLKDVFPSITRFHSRIGKGIDIHLQFYDKNKKRISPGMYFEYLGKKVDNSFKGFAFSNFFYIHKFGWGRVRGRTWNYPYSEGDIPDNCRYIKIFVGLRCSGTMWIDNLDFQFSKWNFTPLERMEPFFKKNYDLTDLIIPTPHSIKNKQHISLKNKNIYLVYNGKESQDGKAAIQLLQKHFYPIVKHTIKVYDTSRSQSNTLSIILINPQNALPSEFESAYQSIKNKGQGYFIRKKGNDIYLGANNGKGLFYASTTLCQLLNYKNSTLDYADITDYPDFTGRSSVLMAYQNKWAYEQNKKLTNADIEKKLEQRQKNLKKQISEVNFYAFYKINRLYSSYFSLSKRWWLPGNFYKEFFKKINAQCAKYGNIITTAVQLNPTFHLNMEQQEKLVSDSLRNLFSYGTDAGFQKIKNALKPALDAGAKTVMLCSDDFVPHAGTVRGDYVLFTKPDKEKFTNLADAQDFLIKRLKNWLDDNYGNIKLEFVPPQYNNLFVDYTRGSAETYFRDLINHLSPDVVIVWTGNTIRSLSYDQADIFRFTQLIKRKPMIWDNSPYARSVEVKNGGYPINYPQKSVLCDLFQPFDIQYIKNFPSYLNPDYYSNLNGFGPRNEIRYLTFADFAWNTKDYNPDFSLFKALYHMVGEKNAMLLLKFNNAYYKFVRSWGFLRWDIEHNPKYKISERQRKLANEQIRILQGSFNRLSPIKNEELKNGLRNVMKAKVKAWRTLENKVSD